MKAWLLYVQTDKEVKELGIGHYESHEEAIADAKRRCVGAMAVGACVAARRVDVPAPNPSTRDNVLIRLEEGGNGESVADKRERAKKILTELIADDLRRKQKSKKGLDKPS